jgi:plasmid stabilization system protein ParE
VAWRFEARVEETLLAILRQPSLGRPRRFRNHQLQGLRSIPLGRPFNKLLLFYRIGADGIEAWRLMHGARDLPRRLAQSPE